jgi:zinc protease
LSLSDWFSVRSLRRSVTVPLVLAVFCGPAAAAVFSPKTFTLDNGLRVVVIENHRAPAVMQMVWYRVGAADEEPGESGLAHFLEHLLFKGTKTVAPGEFSRVVARIGGRDNAFTSYDYTAYYQTVAAHELETVMKLESDRMQNLALNDKVVLPERDVVLEERRSRTDNSPAAQLREQVRRSLYLNHPYGRPVIGWMSEIEALKTENALAFYRKHYAPNNAMLIVAGDVTEEKVRELAQRYYGPIPRYHVPERVRPKEPPQRAARTVTLRSERVTLPSWSRVYLAPSYSEGDRKRAYALEVLGQVLGGGSTSFLYRRLVVERGIASAASAWYSGDALDYGEFGIHVAPKAGGSVTEIETAVTEELERALKEGFSAADIARAKKVMAAEAIYARDGLRAGPNAIGQAFATGLSVEDVEQWPERISAVTPEQVMEAAQAVLDVRKSVTSYLLPEVGK